MELELNRYLVVSGVVLVIFGDLMRRWCIGRDETMPPSETDNYNVTLKDETIEELRELYPAALDVTEAIRMAVDDGMHRRRSEIVNRDSE
jgi:hypothetical protein